MIGMSQDDAQELRKRLELAFPDLKAQLASYATPGLFSIVMHRRDNGRRVVAFYDFPFGMRVVEMTLEPQAEEAR